ncbi:MAG TPA: Gfo/Idh/MocA family oxidoreductase, partial [Flavobacteriaceae bacterium]|nr:Gfo/Idh/MocA family oxidoreductase [Flavobacteriaceae bacterium]
MINVAVVGSGYWGKNLVRNFNELSALHTICDSNPETLRCFKEKYPDKEFQTSLEIVLQNPDIDAVVIATPAETHFELTKKTLLAGKHAFVEKPLALVVSEAEELQRLALNRDLKLMVGHILLYHPAIIKLKEIISSGELGKINYIYSNRLNLGKIRTEENILWSFAPHDISVILYLLEEMPTQVLAQGGNYLNQDIADVTMSILSFKSGVKGHVFVSWLNPNKEQRLVVIGDKRMAVFDDTLAEGKLQIHDKGVEWINRQPVPRKNEAQIIPIDTFEPLKAECAHFLDSIEADKTIKTDANNGIQVLKILNACQESLEKQGTVVSLTCPLVPRSGRRDGNDISQPYFINETAIIDNPCLIGKDTKIWHFSHIMPGAEIGNRCNIGQNVVVSPRVKIGNNVKIQNNVSIYEGVTLEDDVFCGPSMVFTNVINPRSHISRKHEFKKTIVKKGASIGANATIVCGNTIGRYAFIGAGAVVTKNVPDYALVMGNPARVVGWMCEG